MVELWRYQLDEDHFYDLRDLPVGNWSGAKINYKYNGGWLRFSAPNKKRPFNQAHPIDYQKRYIPPKKNLSNALRIPVERYQKEKPEFVVTTESLTDMNDEDSIRNPPIKIEEIPAIRTRSRDIKGTLRDRAVIPTKRPPTHSGTPPQEPLQVNTMVFENDDLIDPGFYVSRSIGTDPYRPPFRVSQLALRKEFKAAMKGEQKARKRPGTTMSQRVPRVTELYGNY